MPRKCSSSRIQQPAQRRPRTERACNFCRIAKQRCEPIEFGTNDRPCRRCVSQGLDCNLPHIGRSQSPSSGPGAQGPGPIHPIASHSGGGATEDLMLGSGANIQYMLQHSESLQAPERRWSPAMMHPEERQGSSTTIILPAGQTQLETTNFLPVTLGVEGYQQPSFPNVVRGPHNPESSYYPQDYYGHTALGGAYVASYATENASEGTPDLGYALEGPQLDDAGASVDEHESVSPSDES